MTRETGRRDVIGVIDGMTSSRRPFNRNPLTRSLSSTSKIFITDRANGRDGVCPSRPATPQALPVAARDIGRAVTHDQQRHRLLLVVFGGVDPGGTPRRASSPRRRRPAQSLSPARMPLSSARLPASPGPRPHPAPTDRGRAAAAARVLIQRRKRDRPTGRCVAGLLRRLARLIADRHIHDAFMTSRKIVILAVVPEATSATSSRGRAAP